MHNLENSELLIITKIKKSYSVFTHTADTDSTLIKVTTDYLQYLQRPARSSSPWRGVIDPLDFIHAHTNPSKFI